MAKSKVGKLEVEIAAKLDKLDQSLRKAEGSVKKSAEKMEDMVEKNNPFGKMATAGATVLATMGAVELAAKGMTAVAKAAKGDWGGVLDTIETMPAGIGPMAAAAVEFLDVLSDGSITFLRTMDEAIKKAERFTNAIRDSVGNRKAFSRQMEMELELARLEPGSLARKEAEIEQKFERRRRQAPGLSAEISRQFDELRSIEINRVRAAHGAGASAVAPGFSGNKRDQNKMAEVLEKIEQNTRGTTAVG